MELPYQAFKEESPPDCEFGFPDKLDLDLDPPGALPKESPHQGGTRSGNGTGAWEEGQRLRLRAVQSESSYFLQLLNVSALRWLALIQGICSLIILLAQIILYSSAHTRYYKIVDYIGIGIWAPLLFFLVAAGLTYITSKSPSGCMIGSAMGLEITSLILTLLLLIFSVISLIQHGYYSYGDNTYNAEIPGRVVCSFMILSAGGVLITSIFIAVHFCRAVCCGRQRMVESVLFDVETVK